MKDLLYIVSIDVGIHHLAIVYGSCDCDAYHIINFECVNITQFQCVENCCLNHTRSLADYLEHIYIYYRMWFDHADYVLIERQPIMGQVAVEQMLFSRFREKAVLLSPRSMHTFLGWNFCGDSDERYNRRKLYSIRLGTKQLSSVLRVKLSRLSRQHDITDAICLLHYWYHMHGRKLFGLPNMDTDIDLFLEQFRYRSKRLGLDD